MGLTMSSFQENGTVCMFRGVLFIFHRPPNTIHSSPACNITPFTCLVLSVTWHHLCLLHGACSCLSRFALTTVQAPFLVRKITRKAYLPSGCQLLTFRLQVLVLWLYSLHYVHWVMGLVGIVRTTCKCSLLCNHTVFSIVYLSISTTVSAPIWRFMP